MIGLMFLGIVAIWMVLTILLWWFWRRVRRNSERRWDFGSIIVTVVAVLWLAGSFWFGGGQKVYYDAKVKRLCAKDGGVKVYETVTLPADRFDSYGNIGVRIKGNAKPTDEYYYDLKTEDIKTGNPSIRRFTSQLIRRSDGKVLGERIRYERGGGDLPLPGQPSSFVCPPIMESRLGVSIFKKGEMK